MSDFDKTRLYADIADRDDTIERQQKEIERLRELVGDVLIDNHRHGHTTPKTLNAIQNHVSEGESDELFYKTP